ncbi:uncharacterized protein LOC134291009 [Aedes albopictus]|uniref:Integrase zinc-binding domain-containing protein n=1 Tax=Aedes albopictus TaxID=7160 RepID=A0ABM1ZT83_AEDAL
MTVLHEQLIAVDQTSCRSWWHFECVGVTGSIAEQGRTFTCPGCQQPSLTIPSDFEKSKVGKSVSKAGSFVSGRTRSSVRARKAQLELEKLEAQKALALKRLELENKKLQLEAEVLEESFRLREEIEREGGSDTGSVYSQQSSRSKVEEWQKQQEEIMSSTIAASAEIPSEVGLQKETTATIGTGASQGGEKQPGKNILDRALQGISLEDSISEGTLGGMIGRTSEIIRQSGTSRVGLPPVSVSSRVPGVSANNQVSLGYIHPHSTLGSWNESNIPQSIAPSLIPSQSQIGGFARHLPASNSRIVSSVVNMASGTRIGDSCSARPVATSESVGDYPVNTRDEQPLLRRRDQPMRNPELHTSLNPERQSVESPRENLAQNADQHGWGPSPQQIAARQVIAKELPTFSGNPEDWPLFISSFTNTTQACGYSDAENLARLQRSLKGNALDAVRSRLLLPAAVPHVIATLETLYGRPELLIHTLLQKVRGAPAPKQDRLETLIGYGMAVQNLSDHLEAGGHQAHLNNPMLLFELVDKLPANMKLDWSLYKQRCVDVNIRAFSQYMATLVRAATDVTLHYDPKHQPEQQQRGARGGKDKTFCGAHSTEAALKTPAKKECIPGRKEEQSSPACLVCKDPEHRVKNCSVFAKKPLEERWKLTGQLGLCRICLGIHGKRPCRIRGTCAIDGCQLRHHTLLHSKQRGNENQAKADSKAEGSSAITNHHSADRAVLFRIVPVMLHGNNRTVPAYAFLDDGSARTLVDEEIAKELGVTGQPLPLCLQWTSNVKRVESDSQQVALEISGEKSHCKFALKDVRTVRKLDLPRQSLRYAELADAFPYLKGLPIRGYENALPRILIGNDNAHVTAMLKMREGQPGEPIASRLGWTVYGSRNESIDHAHSFHICDCEDDQALHDLVKQFFSVESLGVDAAPCLESAEVQRAKRILENTTKRIGQRFETGLLWKYDRFEFPDSYPMAVRRLQCLERRIQKDPVVGESVMRQWSEYQTKGYIHKATPDELRAADPKRTWYLPLGVVINPKKPSKIRIFCDAAAKVDGISMNTMLLKGPDLLNTLLDVLFGFREKQVALCADLKEMFHQIQIRPDDRHAQRLLWREDPAQVPDVYIMDVATFGATCSPCSAQFVKNRNAEEHSSEYPEAAEAIVRKHYVDDYLDSADNVEAAVKIALDVKHVHSLGGFHLRNWLSNSKEVLARVGETDTATEKNLQLDNGNSTERVLGMFWKPEEDVFTFSTTLALETDHPTKRQALRVVMSPFDPVGLLCFFLIHGKILIQELWRSKTDWDQQIPEQLKELWMRWTSRFEQLDEVRVPRCYFPLRAQNEINNLQLHVFVDASEEAYACVAYFRAEFADTVEIAVVGGKAKVAPLKAMSIPRLELMAAVIGVRLLKTIRNGHSLKIDKTVMWSDSKTVLAWINSDHRRYRQFVACRVGEIVSKSDAAQWRWVPTKENPADLATKWGKGPCFSSTSSWFRGPEFLRSSENEWPLGERTNDEATTEEIRICLMHSKAAELRVIEWHRFSNWIRLQRSVAFSLRYCRNLKHKVKKEPLAEGPLTQQELSQAEMAIFRLVQSEEYPDEAAALSAERDQQENCSVRLERTSKIRTLSPFMDDTGVMRSETRICAAAFVSYDTRFPIILPKDHAVTKLLLEWYHRRFLHANGETVVNEVRQRFHISALRSVVRKVAKTCMQCKVRKAVPAVPRMAPLPEARLKPYERPFSYHGEEVDSTVHLPHYACRSSGGRSFTVNRIL